MTPTLKSPVLIISLLCFISAMGRFVIDSYLPSLPAIATDFHLSSASVEMTLTVYLFGFGVSQLIYGPLSDHFGRKKILLIGLAIFLVGALGCALAPSIEILLVSRLIAGLGAGACGVLNRAIASDCFRGAQFAKVWSYTTTTLVITLIVAPLIGGYVQQWANWHANFFVSFIFVSILFLIIIFCLPETHHARSHYGLCVLKIAKNYQKILVSPSFIIATLCYTLAFSGLIAYFQVSPLLYIEQFHFSPSEYGLSCLGIAFSYLLGGLIVKKWVHQLGLVFLLAIGIALLILGGLSMLLAGYCFPDSWQALLFSGIIFILGTRVVIPNAMAMAINEARGNAGATSALIGSIQMLGAMIVSYFLAQCSTQDAIPLAWFLIVIGSLSLGLFLITFLILEKSVAT